MMDLIDGGRSNENPKEEEETSGVFKDGTRWEVVPLHTVTKAILGRYLARVTESAEAAIDVSATDPGEEAVKALMAGVAAAMIDHGRELHDEGYERGDFECKASLGLLGQDGMETERYHEMRAETDAKRRRE